MSLTNGKPLFQMQFVDSLDSGMKKAVSLVKCHLMNLVWFEFLSVGICQLQFKEGSM
jgi:hypothetical protein